jgi:hypothetical protein
MLRFGDGAMKRGGGLSLMTFLVLFLGGFVSVQFTAVELHGSLQGQHNDRMVVVGVVVVCGCDTGAGKVRQECWAHRHRTGVAYTQSNGRRVPAVNQQWVRHNAHASVSGPLSGLCSGW